MNGRLNLETSASILRQVIRKWFTRKKPGIEPIFFESGQKLTKIKRGHVVLFGDFIFALCEWFLLNPESEIKLYVLCHNSHKVLVSFFPAISGRIEVINRYELFPSSRSFRNFPGQEENWNLVFSGRISQSKHILLLLNVVSILQIKYDEKVSLKLIGEFDEQPNLAVWTPPMIPECYREQVRKKIDLLHFNIPPLIIHQEGPDSWVRHLDKQSVLISLSENWAEDFGVSVAQAQALGTPMILSEVGAHNDVQAPNLLTVPGHLLHNLEAASHLTAFDIAFAAAAPVAELIHRRKLNSAIESSLVSTGKYIYRSDISEALHQWNISGLHLQRSYKFLPQPNRPLVRDFWRLYQRQWIPNKAHTVTLLVLSADTFTWPSIRFAFRSIFAYWFSQQTVDRRVAIVSSSDSKLTREHLSRHLERVVYVGLNFQEFNHARPIREFLPHVNFWIYTFNGPSLLYSAFRDLAPFFQTRDKLIVTGKSDYELTQACFKNASVVSAEYFSPAKHRIIPYQSRTDEQTLYYAGRISEQKGLHYLIWSLYLLKENSTSEFRLEILGFPDDLGVPHLGISARQYLKFLKNLISQLGLTEQVILRGTIPYDQVLREFAERKLILVLPSLHHDENFSLFIKEGLQYGCLAVTTAWGGLRSMPEQLRAGHVTIPVQTSASHLYINAFQLSQALLKAIGMKESYEFKGFSLPSHINENERKESSAVDHLISSPWRTEFISSLKEKKKHYKRGQVFSPQDDHAILHRIWRIYGAEPLIHSTQQIFCLTPWTSVFPDRIEIRDPLQDEVSLPRTRKETVTVYGHDAKTKLQVSKDIFKYLIDSAQLVPLPDRP